MSYNLYVTRANGSTFKTLRSPYPDREGTTATVRMIMRGNPPFTEEFATQLADAVAAAPLGEVVTHDDTPVSFRTEAAD